MKIQVIIMAVMLGSALFISARAQELVTNGGYEIPSVPTVSVFGIGLLPGAETFVAGDTDITGWTISSGSVSVVDSGGTLVGDLGLLDAAQGNQYAVLNGLTVNALGVLSVGATGALTQTISTVAGNVYQISFEYGGISVGLLTGTPTLNVSFSNSTDSTGPAGGILSVSIGGFSTETFEFTATGSSSLLTFYQDNASVADVGLVALDDVTVTDLGAAPVPEPSQYAAAAGGFLCLLVMGRLVRKRFGKTSEDESLQGLVLA